VTAGQKPTIKKLLIANRGEIAVRIARTAAEMGIQTVAVYPADDEQCLHVRRADQACLLPGQGAQAYLDIDAILQVARHSGAGAIHPGYGFLAENPEFARRVEEAGLIFVGPSPELLALLGNKTHARQFAADSDIPVLPGTSGDSSLEELQEFFQTLPAGAAMLIKAVAGGGGRGMRIVTSAADVADAWTRCRSEAQAAFGNPAVYAERFLSQARHIEVQILGDGLGTCVHFGERECSLQRRHQKVIELAPSPNLLEADREQVINFALTLAQQSQYRSLGTFEFLLDVTANDGQKLFFIEANPRIQVEHTVTEAVFGVDLVQLQLAIAGGQSLKELGITQTQTGKPKGFAMQFRINMEHMDANANATPTSGTIQVFEPPAGAGMRTDSLAFSGYRTSSRYDSLLAKLVVHSGDSFDALIRKSDRALREFRLIGVDTNLGFLRALLAHPDVQKNHVTTRFIEQHATVLAESSAKYACSEHPATPAVTSSPDSGAGSGPQTLSEGAISINAPMQATVAEICVVPGDAVNAGQQLAVLEAMKMEHVLVAPCGGKVLSVTCTVGNTVCDTAQLMVIVPDSGMTQSNDTVSDVDPDYLRADFLEVQVRHAFGLDENRPEAVAKRYGRGHRTARENLAELCDPDSFIEYGALAVAAQHPRRTRDDLALNTTGDGVITGFGSINGGLFGEARSSKSDEDPDANPDTVFSDRTRCAFAVYDYMVLAGTQGVRHHRKLDRLFHLCGEWNVPLILLPEGGGGRPGDIERATYAGISTTTFSSFANLSGQVPLVGMVSGRCFAGNAAFLGCCDVIIADESSNIGMAGPAMIEGGGLGVYPPEAIGPIDEQCRNGVVDIRVHDEAEGCRVARQYISYFQGAVNAWSAPDQRLLRHVVPENRLRVYEVRDAIYALADVDSVLELRKEFGIGIVTALIRIEGKPFGLIANNPNYLGGAIDSPAADKASRFMQLCDAFDIPLLSMCDTPGFMVGPEAEKTALVRHVSRMFVTARSMTVPVFSVVLRKCYGLGAQAMLGGGAYDNFFTISWPTGEFGPMGLEGAVKLGYRRELDALTDPAEKQSLYEKLLAEYYQQGKAIQVASTLEIDAVIDPARTREWILAGLRTVKLRPSLSGRKRPMVDAW
jgi:acetyl/propionyl-CoA carboxylase alpha subunit/acetyl-CoA carboxylase carboxyltransferase component